LSFPFSFRCSVPSSKKKKKKKKKRKKKKIYFMYVSTPSLSSDTPEEGIGSHYRRLWATMWLLGFELRASGRAVSALNHWAISAAPHTLYFLLFCFFEIGSCCIGFGLTWNPSFSCFSFLSPGSAGNYDCLPFFYLLKQLFSVGGV